VIRVAVADDHHAVRLGLHAALRSEPGLVPVGAASDGHGLAPLLRTTAPDVVLLDYHLPDTDGLTLCRRIKADPPAPAVILYSGFADDSMTVPALVAGADGIVHKGEPARDLFEAIRRVARGGSALPAVSPPLLRAAGEALDPQDRPVLAMLVDGTSPADIAATLQLGPGELRERITRMLARLKVPVPG
jgi:two-component system, NarL family, response regulator DevR